MDTEQLILEHFKISEAIEDPWGQKISVDHVADYFKASRQRFRLLTDTVQDCGIPGSSVLEIGPAYGATLIELQRMGYNVSACEMPDCISAYCGALTKMRIPLTPWDIHKSDCPLECEAYDVILASEVIEHLQISVKSAIARIAKPLKPGGSLIVTTPNLYRLPNLLKIIRGHNITSSFADIPVIKNNVVVDNRAHPREPAMYDLVEGMISCAFIVSKRSYFNTGPKSRFQRSVYGVLPKTCREHLLVVGRRG